MKILLNACVPRLLRRFLSTHSVRTAQEMGWGSLKNGELLRVAEAQSDVFVSTDLNLRNQQRLLGRQLAILTLPTNDWPTIRSQGKEIASKIDILTVGDFSEMNRVGDE